MAEVEFGGGENGLHAAQSLCGIGPIRTGNVVAIARLHANASGRHVDLLAFELANGHGVNLDRRIGGHAVHAEHGARRRILREEFCPNLIERGHGGRLVQVDLQEDHVFHGQAGRGDNGLDVIKRLAHASDRRGWQPAILVAHHAVARDIEIVAGEEPRTVGRSGRRLTGRLDHLALGGQ